MNKILITSLILVTFLIANLVIAGESLQAANNKEVVVLIHGYNKDYKDMLFLKEYLEEKNYKAVTVDLPLRFRSVEYATEIFKDKMNNIIAGLKVDQKLSFIGHSTGGLIIRKYLDEFKDRKIVNRAVQIATPNQGSSLATFISDISALWSRIFSTLESLEPKNLEAMDLIEGDAVEIGAIAGNKSTRFFGRFLEGENDGRVKVQSVKFPGLSDFIVIPYHHNEIHHQKATAELVDKFLKTGRFN
ncbi:MAG: esterase/lipase family protein [Halarsenatibacteraceae bacterium]